MADLDDILNSALDDIDDEDEANATDLSSAVKEAAEKSALAAESENAKRNVASEEGFEESTKKLMEELNDPEFAKSLEETLKMFAAQEGGGAGNNDDDIPETLKALAEAAKGLEGADANQAEAMGEEIMQQMMKQFEQMGNKEDFQQVMDGMMQQLMSKEVMYTPFKQCCDKFPTWLADNESSLSKEEYERYGKQYQYYQRICAVYETEPDNFAKLTELMQEMQEFGQPPADIIKELAPGLEMSPDGVPVLPGMMGNNLDMPGPDPSQCAQQ